MLASSQERVEQFEQLLQGEAASTVSADEASTVVVSTTLYYSIADPTEPSIQTGASNQIRDFHFLQSERNSNR